MTLESPTNLAHALPPLGGARDRLIAALGGSADPANAPARALEVLKAAQSADDERLERLASDRADVLIRVLTKLCASAPFFVPMLARHPEWLFRLCHEDFGSPRTKDEMEARLSEAVRDVPSADQPAVIRKFKYYELARITVRDLSPDLVPEERAGETLAELSHLADALLGRAYVICASRMQERYGPPIWTGASGERVTLGFVALGLGKLGSRELNYSSDVDLIYVFGSARGADEEPSRPLDNGPGNLSPVEYFTRLAQEFGKIARSSTAEGFLYRVDLDLRPEGSRGPLVVSATMLADYYESWAATWEKAAFMKARPVSGDLDLGWQIVRAIDPMIYRSTMDHESVSAIKDLKDKVEAAKGRAGETFHVKLGPGGIRDVESVAQALLLLHGGRVLQVRSRSTETALVSLAEVGLLPKDEAADLLRAYRFFRRTENRLQMVAERQTHHLPSQHEDLERLARGLNFDGDDPVSEFESALAEHRNRTQEIFGRLFHEDGSDRILSMFAREVPGLLANSLTRPMIEQLAAQFGREIDSASDPLRALNNLDRFIQGVGASRFYYELLLDRPELVPRLVALFATSKYLSSYFANYPRLIEPIFADPSVLTHSRADLEESFAAIRHDSGARDVDADPEKQLEALRLVHHREVLNVGLLDAGNKITRQEAEAALSGIAEICLDHALAIAQSQLKLHVAELPPEAREGQFLVVGMGKLASRELTYGSDLDVVFLYDVASDDPSITVEAQAYHVRLAQKLIWALRTRTADGICYDIDARLRPSGNQGMLVVSLASFEKYHETSAQVWERQALLRARPVAGSERLGDAFERIRLEILRRPLPVDAAEQIHRIRLRTESELAHETARRHDFKTGHGGLHDVETIVQLLQLKHGAEHETLFEVVPIAEQLTRLERLRLIEAENAAILLEGWDFLQRLSSRLRIVENRSISDLDEERGDLDALARSLGYVTRQREGGARRALLDDYRQHTRAIRSVYQRIMGTIAP